MYVFKIFYLLYMIFNKYYILETLQIIFVNMCVSYTEPNRAKKKKMSEFVHSIPHLFFNEPVQNELFRLIQENPIDQYYDNATDLRKYFYYIYSELSKYFEIKPKAFSTFYNEVEYEIKNENKVLREIRMKYINSILYFIVIATILYIYFKYFSV